MMRIVHVVEAFGAGTLSIVCGIANGQALEGHAVFVLHAVREETPVAWRTLFDARIKCVQLPMVRAIRPAADWRAARMLFAQLKHIEPNVVHLHSSKAGALGRLLSLIYPHPDWFFSPHGLSFLQSAEGRVKNTFFLLIEKILALIPVTFIACSLSEAQKIRVHLTQRVVVVNNAVDLSQIRQAAGRPGQIRIGTSGRVTPARNPELFAAVAEQLKQSDIEFTWIGGGEKKGEARLRSAGVHITGWLTHEDALEALSSLDLYIQTSQWEGLPVAVIEAMAAGLPVVATDIIGNCDLIKNGENGWLVNDAAGFVGKLKRLIENKNERTRMGIKARELAFAHHSLEQMVKKLNQAYARNTGF